ncbi:MAG: hypothetical protein IPK68_09120 [Bdellovibrionales bacterium]|nr:hypothetical protein [Bdellovibrionales bacterium]
MNSFSVTRIGVREQFQNDRPIFWLVRLVQKHSVHFELKLAAIKRRVVIQKIGEPARARRFSVYPSSFSTRGDFAGFQTSQVLS